MSHRATRLAGAAASLALATWPHETYPVTDGRTLFWRDDILIDSRYSNLAPSGYTAAIVASVFG